MENLNEILGDALIEQDNEVPVETQADVRYVALYFAANWDPAALTFLPQLVDFYNEVNFGKKVSNFIINKNSKLKSFT